MHMLCHLDAMFFHVVLISIDFLGQDLSFYIAGVEKSNNSGMYAD